MSTARRLAFGACAGLLAVSALPGLRAGADGAVTPRNLVFLSYSSGGRGYQKALRLRANGVAQADVWDSRASVVHQTAVNKLSPARLARTFLLVNAVNFPALKPQPPHSDPRVIDGSSEEIGLVCRDSAGRRREYSFWTTRIGPAPLVDLCVWLDDITDQELKALAVQHKARRRHRPS